jgi:hypothetical protein
MAEKRVNLLEELFKKRDIQREIVKKGIKVVKGKELPVENNRITGGIPILCSPM